MIRSCQLGIFGYAQLHAYFPTHTKYNQHTQSTVVQAEHVGKYAIIEAKESRQALQLEPIKIK